MGRIMVDNYTAEEIKQWYNEGKEISYRIKDGDSLYFRTTISKLKKKVIKTKDKKFRIADGYDVTFEEYSEVIIDSSNRRHIKVGTKDNRDRRGEDQIVSFNEFDAFAKEFGIDELRLKSDISLSAS